MGHLFHKILPKKVVFTANQSMALFKFRLGAMLALKQGGVEVIAIAPPDQYSKKITASGITFLPLEMATHHANPLKDLILFWHLLKLYRSLKPSLIFHYTIKPNIYGHLAAHLAGGIPSVGIVPGRGYTFHKRNGLFYLVKLLYRLSIRFAHEVWFLNEEDQQFFIEEKIVTPEKTHVLPSEGVDTNHYTPAHPTSHSNQPQPFTFLFSGRLLWEKGVGIFVEAARMVRQRFPDTRFQLLGFLDPTDHRVVPPALMCRWVAEGIVTYLGETTDVRPYFRQADCFVLPSFYGEGVPRTLLEAASMGLPLITTDHQGCRRALQDGITGMLCPPRDAVGLAEKMIAMMSLPATERVIMGLKGREMMKQCFDESFLVAHYLQKTFLLLEGESKPPAMLEKYLTRLKFNDMEVLQKTWTWRELRQMEFKNKAIEQILTDTTV